MFPTPIVVVPLCDRSLHCQSGFGWKPLPLNSDRRKAGKNVQKGIHRNLFRQQQKPDKNKRDKRQAALTTK
eukprot:4448297-Amphidinium_carterae.1